ncbi:MAG: dihydropteroate synthase [Chloroflexi bacterium]|nr:dihydropteroate synthase [Chloroflexota bacterium]
MRTERIATVSRGVLRCAGREFRWGSRTYVMGIVNLTPDSFSGDGLGYDIEGAVHQARRFVAEGADIVDIGGESNRPGTGPMSISVEEECRRVLPVVQALARTIPVPISIDTYKAEVARRALEAGAHIINDIWGLRYDPEMAPLAARTGAPVVLMHNQQGTEYRDLIPDIIAWLGESLAIARAAGVPHEHLIIDPGIGFGKTWEHTFVVLRRLREFQVLGCPVLVGTSRKSFIGRVLNLPVQDRLEGTAASVAVAIAHGADLVRVHDVREMVRVCRVSDAIIRGVVEEPAAPPPAPTPADEQAPS